MIEPLARQVFSATLTLSEAEVRLLNHLAGYDLGPTIAEHVTKDFDARLLADLLARIRGDSDRCIRAYDAARKAFEAVGSRAALPVI